MKNGFHMKWSRLTQLSFQMATGMIAVSALPSIVIAGDQDQLVATGLTYAPRQPGISYDKVEDKDRAACTGKIEKQGSAEGLAIYSADGQILRRFSDTNNDRNVDQWSYYKDGIEIYRDIDSDFNGVADQYRWLGTAGTRWGIDKNEDGKIDTWKTISAEEVTIEVVEAAKARDDDRFRRLLLTDSDIKSLHLGEEKSKQLLERVEKARSEFMTFARSQKSIVVTTKWTHFAADKPGVIPAGTDGSEQDNTAYENVIAIIDNDSNSQQLVIGTLVQVGADWKLTELPRLANESSVADNGFFFPSVVGSRMAMSNAGESSLSQGMQNLLSELDRVDVSIRDGRGERDELHGERAEILMKLVQANQGSDDLGSWIRQFADTVSSAAQGGEYPGGLDKLRDLQKLVSNMPGASDQLPYVAYRVIATENMVKLSDENPNYAKVQKEYMDNLSLFADTFPESIEAADAMIQIGLNHELAVENDKAETWYERVAQNFATTQQGKTAAGAIRRLNLEGKTLTVRGKTLEGKSFESKGPTIVHYWATWCEPCKRDMAELRKLQAAYRGLQIVGMNLDNTKKIASDFMEQNRDQYPWPHIYEEGGFLSDSAVQLGILSVPVTILIDQKGTVVKCSSHLTDEIQSAVEKMMTGNAKPVAVINPNGQGGPNVKPPVAPVNNNKLPAVQGNNKPAAQGNNKPPAPGNKPPAGGKRDPR